MNNTTSPRIAAPCPWPVACGANSARIVLNMYNAGMVTLKRQPYQRDDPAFPVKSPHLKPLGLNRQDLADLAAFLGALEEPRQRVLPPPLPAIEGEPVTATRQPPGR
jgi:hypothetical protein